MKKGEITLKVLEAIGETAINFFDLMAVIIGSRYGASHGKLDYEFRKRQVRREVEKEKQLEKQKFYDLVYRLKKQGLIQKKENKLKLTKLGFEKLKFLRERKKEILPDNNFSAEKGNNFCIVIFDVPEVERRKRDWLRGSLGHLGLKMVQKSVWIGKVKIPKPFLNSLFKLKMLDYVEIFEITKTGSLKHIA